MFLTDVARLFSVAKILAKKKRLVFNRVAPIIPGVAAGPNCIVVRDLTIEQ